MKLITSSILSAIVIEFHPVYSVTACAGVDKRIKQRSLQLTAVPTDEPTLVSSASPTASPNVMPYNATTEPPVATLSVNLAIDNIQVTFRDVNTIPAVDLLTLQTIMEEWFEAYFNVAIEETVQRSLYQHTKQHRSLQFRVPAVRNMNTVVDVTVQDTTTTSGSCIVTYTQNLDYDATSDARTPFDYVLLPFVDTPYKNELFDRLKSDVGSFATLSALSTPVIAVYTNQPTQPSEPTIEPTAAPSATPTVSPTKKSTGTASAVPYNTTTKPPVETQTINLAINNIQITFRNVNTIPVVDLKAVQTTVEEWFEAYFNVEIEETVDRSLHKHTKQLRGLQFRVPSVRNMNTVVDVTVQDTATTSGSCIVTYTQNMDYDATSDARTPVDYALLPFVDTSYKNELFDRLKSDVGSFANLTSISTPVIAESPEVEEPPNVKEPPTNEESRGTSLSIVIGIVMGVATMAAIFMI